MFDKKHIVTVALILLLGISLYYIYTSQENSFIDLQSVSFLLFSIFLLIISLFSLNTYLKNSNQATLLRDLAVHISNITASAKKINKDKFLNEKMAYEYIKSNYDNVYQRESKLRSESQVSKAFLNNFSYEIRTPMNAIFGYTKLLKETSLNSEQQNLISIIENSYQNLNLTLDEMSLDISEHRSKFETKEEPFNIVKEVETAVETFSVKADEKDIVLGLYIDPLISHNLLGDGEKISQVLTHVIDNALAVSEAYSTVDIRLEKVSSKKEYEKIKFTIFDEGQGLEEEELESIKKIFRDMEIVDKSPTVNIRNLTISNRIIKRMGGTLNISSKINEGSSFSFILSFKKDSEEVDIKLNPVFNGLKIGLALPHKDIKRQVDYNLKTYVEYLGGTFDIYGYDEVMNNNIQLPDVLFVYHSYAKNKGELDALTKLNCKIVLITSGTLRSQINLEKHTFSSVVYAPITMSKILTILADNKEKSLSRRMSDKKTASVKILVVEDNIISQTIIANILINMNIDVTVASNGKEAVEFRKENRYNMVLMDIKMPIMNGYEATEKILSYEKSKNQQHVPIIAFSTDTSKSDKQKYIDAGMDDLISKPVHADEIQSIIEKYCSHIMKK